MKEMDESFETSTQINVRLCDLESLLGKIKDIKYLLNKLHGIRGKIYRAGDMDKTREEATELIATLEVQRPHMNVEQLNKLSLLKKELSETSQAA